MKKVALIAIVIATLLFIAWLPCQAQQVPWVCPNDDEVNGTYWICNYFPLKPKIQWQYTTGEYHVVNDIRTCSSGYSGILYATETYEYSPYMQNGEHGLLFAGCHYDEGEFEDGGSHFVSVPPQVRLGETIAIDTEWGRIDINIVGFETISVPAGTFNAMKIEWIMNSSGGSSCLSYKTTAWLAKDIGPVKFHRTDANPPDCLGCMFVCDPDNDIVRLNTPAELTSFNLNQGTPKISVSPMSVNLGSVRTGGTSNPRTVTIKNTGNGDLIINSITITGPNQSEFIESDDCSIVPAKSTCPITVTFAPQPPFGKKTAVMGISSNDPKKPAINVKLSGQAPPPKIAVSPKSIKFGTVEVGITSDPKIVTIKNTGTSNLTINAVTFEGPNAAEFSQSNNCTTVEKGSSCSIGVIFTPTSAGSKSAVMSIASNDSKKPIVTIKLAGKAIPNSEPVIEYSNYSGQWIMDTTVTDTAGACHDDIGGNNTFTITLTVSENGDASFLTPNACGGANFGGKFENNVLTISSNNGAYNCGSGCATACCGGTATLRLTFPNKDNAVGTLRTDTCCTDGAWTDFRVKTKRAP